MQISSQALTEHTIAVWQPRTARRLSCEDAREITANLTGFFAILAEWTQNERKTNFKESAERVSAPPTGGQNP